MSIEIRGLEAAAIRHITDRTDPDDMVIAGEDEQSPYMLLWEEMTPCQRLGSEFGAIFRREQPEETTSPLLLQVMARFGGWDAFPEGSNCPSWEDFRAAYNAVIRERLEARHATPLR